MVNFVRKLDGNIKIALVVAGVVLLWMVSGIFSSDSYKSHEVKEKFVKSVTIKPILSEPYFHQVKVTGRSTPYKHAYLAAQTSGEIAEITADVGSVIKGGDTLITIDIATRNEALKAAQASLDEAKVLYVAAKKLNKQGFKADTSLAGRIAALAKAKESLAKIKQDIAYTKINSPINGVVERRLVTSGDYVAVGDVVLEVVNRSRFILKASLSQKHVGKVKKGQQTTAILANGQEVEGKVTFVATNAEEATKTYPIEIEVDGKTYQIPTGMTAEIIIPTEKINAHLVPTAALVLGDDGIVGVTTVGDGSKVEFNKVKILDMPKDGVWVSGLAKTANVIIRGQTAVIDGEVVTARIVEKGK